jgi:hypothetical protein
MGWGGPNVPAKPNTDPLTEKLLAYWNSGIGDGARTSTLWNALTSALRHTGMDIKEFRESAFDEAGSPKIPVTALTRFIEAGGDGGLKPREKLSWLLCTLWRFCDARGLCAEGCATEFKRLRELHDSHQRFFTDQERSDLLTARRRTSKQEQDRLEDAFLGKLKQTLHTKGSFQDTARAFFEDQGREPPVEPIQRRFVCYRFANVPGKIVKSFIVITSPSKAEAYCSFSNYFVAEPADKPRKTKGIIIPMKSGLYLLGQVGNGRGLKVMFMPDKRDDHERPMEDFQGLMLSFDENDGPIAARFVMTPSDCMNHADAGCGIWPIQKLRQEIGPDNLRNIRNRVEFNLEGALMLGLSGLTQDAMVEETERRMLGDGAETSLTLDGKPFNPADSRFYTFNSALRAAK